MDSFIRVPSPVGELVVIGSAEGLRAVLWEADLTGASARLPAARVPIARALQGDSAREDPDAPLLKQARRQLEEYFARKRRSFDLPLAPAGTPFQLRAWQALRTIGYGETLTYSEQAARMGDPGKARAVGAANGRNPLSILVPCHRVIGRDGSLTGFAGGLAAKRFLLALERG